MNSRSEVFSKYSLIVIKAIYKVMLRYFKWGVKHPIKFVLTGFIAFLVVSVYHSIQKENDYIASLTPEQKMQYEAKKQAERDAKKAKEEAEKAIRDAKEKEEQRIIDAKLAEKNAFAESVMRCAGAFDRFGTYRMSKGNEAAGVELSSKYITLAKSINSQITDSAYNIGASTMDDIIKSQNESHLNTFMNDCFSLFNLGKAKGYIN